MRWFPTCDAKNVQELSPVLLAYVGDAVYELYVRTRLLTKGNRPVREIHNEAVGLVRASTQARLLREITHELSDEEREVIRRARNSKKASPSRNVDAADYRLSTGLEALFGYLYLKGEEERLEKYLDLAWMKFEQLQSLAI